MRLAAEVLVRQRDLDQQAPRPPLPADYSRMTPAEQAAADLGRRRAQYQAHQAAITAAATPQPGDDDITDAEIIDP